MRPAAGPPEDEISRRPGHPKHTLASTTSARVKFLNACSGSGLVDAGLLKCSSDCEVVRRHQ
jgi:hypothetical protein